MRELIEGSRALPVLLAAALLPAAAGSIGVSKGLPDGTPVSVYSDAQLTGDAVYSGDAGFDATATASSGRLSFTLSIPYSWLVTSAADTVAIQVELSGSAQGSTVTYDYTGYLTQTIALPKNGATTPV